MNIPARDGVHHASAVRRAIFIVGPDGQAGGGMGRVKDLLLHDGDALGDGLAFVPLVTRDQRGAIVSLGLVARAVLTIWWAKTCGRVALVHVNVGDRGSFVRKAIVILASRAAGVPVVLHLHAVALERQAHDANALLRWLIRLPFRAASSTIVLGDRWHHWLTGALHLPNARIDVLSNGVFVPPVSSRVHRAKPQIDILFLGNLLERKGVADLLAALATLDNIDWHATFAGGGDVARYETLARTLDLSSRVTFTGWVDQVEARHLVAASDMLVLPSYEEGLPLVILEALGCGTPVICTPVGSISEVLWDRETALFCTPGDRAMLASHLRELAQDDGLRQRLASNGLALFAQKFSLAAFRRDLFSIYRRRCGLDIRLPDAIKGDMPA